MVGLIVSVMSKPLYRARTTIKVEPERATPFDIGSAANVYVRDPGFLATETELLEWREVAARVVEKLNLTEHPAITTPGSKGFLAALAFWRDPEAPPEVSADALALQIQGGVNAAPVRGTNLVEVTYVASSPQLAADIANGVASSYVEWNLESKFEVLAQASRFRTRSPGSNPP